MRIALVGAVESTAVTLDALCAAGQPPVAVVGLRAELAARHSDFVDLEALAKARDLPFIGVDNVNAPEALEAIAALDLDWLIVVGWSQICRAPLLALPRQGCIGYHPAALPRLRGRAVLAWTILLDLPRTAGSLFLLEPTVDSGPLLAQHEFDLAHRETVETLIAKHMAALGEMWRGLLPLGSKAALRTLAQDEAAASYCARRTAADGLIDWSADATQVDRLVRAVSRPYPGAFSWWKDHRLSVWAAEPWGGPVHYGAPGQILAADDRFLLVSCGGYTALRITAWSLEGDASPGPRVGQRLNNAPA